MSTIFTALHVTRIPDRDLNAVVVIKDETMLLRDHGDNQLILYIYVKGIKPATIIPEEPLQSVVNVPTSSPDLLLPLSSKALFNSPYQSSVSADDNHDYIMDEPVIADQNQPGNGAPDIQQDQHVPDDLEPGHVNDTFDSGDVTHSANHAAGISDHVTGEDTPIGHGTPGNNIYYVDVSSSAAKYSNIFEVSVYLPYKASQNRFGLNSNINVLINRAML